MVNRPKAPQLPPHMGRFLRCPSPIGDQVSRTDLKRTVPLPNVQYLLRFSSLIVRSSPFHRLIARPIQLCLRCDAPLVRLSAPACGRRFKPKAYCSQTLSSAGESLVDDILSTLVPPCLGKDLTHAFLFPSLLSLRTFSKPLLFET